MPKINISKIAYGSLTTNIGDGTLGYSNGVSSKAREVDGIYVDNPPVLSTDYSSLVWKYFPETDNYMLTHVQGQHTVEAAMARIYPYRGAYEVSRDEMNRANFPVAAVMDCMPRIRHYEEHETWETETELGRHVLKADSAKARALALAIELVVNDGRRLYIEMDAKGRNLKENGVFAAEEFLTLVEAIDLLDVNLRRYASFAFCVDENHEVQLDDVLVVVYVKGSKIGIPQDALQMEWKKALSSPAAPKSLDLAHKVYPALPGKSEKVIPLSAMFKKLEDGKKRLSDLDKRPHASFTAEDYRLWLGLGHTASELSAKSWEDIDKILRFIGDDKKAVDAFVANHKAKVVSWPIGGLTKERIQMFGLKDIMDVKWIGAHSKEIGPRLDYWFDVFKSLSLMKGDVKECFRQTYLENFKKERISSQADFESLKEKYKGKIENSDFTDRIAGLDAVKDMLLIDDLLNLKPLYPALCKIAQQKARQLGMDVDKWMRFLDSLKDGDTVLKKSVVLYIKAIGEWSKEDVNKIKNLAAEYPSAHPRKAQSELFITFLKKLKQMDGDTEPISPSSETCETKGKTSETEGGKAGETKTGETKDNKNEKSSKDMDTENKGLDSKFDRLYEEVMQTQTKKKKNKLMILCAASFLVGLLIMGGAWGACAKWISGPGEGPGGPDGPAKTDSIHVSLSFEEPQNIMLKLANLDSLIEGVTVEVGDTSICGITDIKKLYSVDSLYMLNGSHADYADAVADVFKVDSVGNTIDKTKNRIKFGKNTSLLSQVYTEPYRVDKVFVYIKDGKDSLKIDINNTFDFYQNNPDKTMVGTNDLKYYLWFIRQVNNYFVKNKKDSKIAY